MTVGADHENVHSQDAFQALHAGLTVGLIATPRDHLMTCRPDESVRDVMARNTEPYDFLPVIGDSDIGASEIVGLFRAEEFFDASAVTDSIRDHVITLSESYVIGADASILEFICDADRKPCRMVVAGSRIVGVVSLSDMQNLPVRAALFGLITGFEMTMAAAIERHVGDASAWLPLLSPGRQENIQREIEKSHREDGFVDSLLFTQFCDKKTIITRSLNLPYSKRDLQSRLDDLETLRNNLAHANEYAATPRQARGVCVSARNLLQLHGEICGLEDVGQNYADGIVPREAMETQT